MLKDNQILKTLNKGKSLSTMLNQKTSKALFDLSFKMESLKEMLIFYKPHYYLRERISKLPLYDIVCEINKIVPHLQLFNFLETVRSTRNLLVHSPLKLIESKDSMNLVFILNNNLDNVLVTIFNEIDNLKSKLESPAPSAVSARISSDFRTRD